MYVEKRIEPMDSLQLQRSEGRLCGTDSESINGVSHISGSLQSNGSLTAGDVVGPSTSVRKASFGTLSSASAAHTGTPSLHADDREGDSPSAMPTSLDDDDDMLQASPLRRAQSIGQSDLYQAPVFTTGKLNKVRDGRKKKINRYVVLDLLGRGAYSKVKLCQHEVDGTYYAMKILSRSVLKSRGVGASSALGKFRREVAILKRLRHPHIIALQEVIDDPQSEKLYLVLELAEGRELVRLDDHNCVEPDEDGVNRIPEKAVQRLAVGLVDAVAYAHENGIAHRDIKPQNILLTDQFVPKLSDFGVSAIIDDSPLVTCTEGTMSFLAPELLELTTTPDDGDIDSFTSIPSWHGSFAVVPRVSVDSATPVQTPEDTPVVDLFKGDVWSLALTLFVVVTGYHPWPEATCGSSLLKAIQKNPMHAILKDLKKKMPSLSEELLHFLDWGMKSNPEERMTIFEAKEHPWITKTLLKDQLRLTLMATPPPEKDHASNLTSLPSSRVHSSVDLNEDDVAQAITYGQLRVAGNQSTNSPPTHLYIRRAPCYTSLRFNVNDSPSFANTGAAMRTFAYDDSCIVALRPEQVERELLHQSLHMSLSTFTSLQASPQPTRPPSPTNRTQAFPFVLPESPKIRSPEVHPQRPGGSPPQALSPTALEAAGHTPTSSSASPDGERRRRRGHTRSLSQPSISNCSPHTLVELGEVTPNHRGGKAGGMLTLPPTRLQLEQATLSDSQLSSSGRDEAKCWEEYFRNGHHLPTHANIPLAGRSVTQ